MKIEICLIVISCYNTLITATCPSPAVIAPCKCGHLRSEDSDETIYCGGNDRYDLRNAFISLSTALKDDEKHFEVFYLNNTAISELVMNVFYDITFDRIEIENAYNLTQINSHAFMPTISQLNGFVIHSTPIGGDVFAAINTMINIEYVDLSNTSLTDIPSNAFTLLTQLYEIAFTDNSMLKSMGNYSFYELNTLDKLYLTHNPIDSIAEHAFSFRERNTFTLTIYFYLENLTTKSFSNSTFTSINRRFQLFLWSDPQLKYLDEMIFQTVLANGNQIYLFSSPLECDCRSYWLFANRAQYDILVHGSVCSDGNSVFADRHNYTDCSNV